MSKFPRKYPAEIACVDVTHLKTPDPHPANEEKTRGAKSRAGFKGDPQLCPNASIISDKSVNPMASGINPLGTFMFFSSVMAQIIKRKKLVATN